MTRGYSISYPIARDEQNGFFKNTKNLTEVVRQNFRDLLLTNPAERPIHQEYGVGIMAYLFEPNVEAVQDNLLGAISSQVSQFLPYIEIEDIVISRTHQGRGIQVDIYFFITTLGVRDQISINA